MANLFDIFSKKSPRTTSVSENEQTTRFVARTPSYSDGRDGVNSLHSPFENKDGAKGSGNVPGYLDPRFDKHETASPFTIPKLKKVQKDLLTEISLDSREWQQEILPAITKHFRNSSSFSKFEFYKACTVNNPERTQQYLEKRREMRQSGYSERDVADSFAFLYMEDDRQVERVCREGLAVGNLTNSTIGHPGMGVQLSRYIDYLMPVPFAPVMAGKMLVCKIMKGRVKAVAENRAGTYLEPTPNCDSHIAKPSLDATPSSHLQMFESNQIYLFEYGDLNVEKVPRHVLPFALVSFRYKEIMPVIKVPDSPSMLSSPKLQSPMGSSRMSVSTAKDVEDPEYVIWCGRLKVKDLLDCQVKMVSTASMHKPARLGTMLDLKYACDMKAAAERYFGELTCLRKGGEVYWKGWYINVAELRPRPDSKALFQRLRNYLCKTDTVAVVKPENDTVLLLVPDSNLTADLGLSRQHHFPVMLHCIFLSRQSSKFKSPRYLFKALHNRGTRGSSTPRLDHGPLSPLSISVSAPGSPAGMMSPLSGTAVHAMPEASPTFRSSQRKEGELAVWAGAARTGTPSSRVARTQPVSASSLPPVTSSGPSSTVSAPSAAAFGSIPTISVSLASDSDSSQASLARTDSARHVSPLPLYPDRKGSATQLSLGGLQLSPITPPSGGGPKFSPVTPVLPSAPFFSFCTPAVRTANISPLPSPTGFTPFTTPSLIPLSASPVPSPSGSLSPVPAVDPAGYLGARAVRMSVPPLVPKGSAPTQASAPASQLLLPLDSSSCSVPGPRGPYSPISPATPSPLLPPFPPAWLSQVSMETAGVSALGSATTMSSLLSTARTQAMPPLRQTGSTVLTSQEHAGLSLASISRTSGGGGGGCGGDGFPAHADSDGGTRLLSPHRVSRRSSTSSAGQVTAESGDPGVPTLAHNLMRLHRSLSTDLASQKSPTSGRSIPLGYDEGFLMYTPTSALVRPDRLQNAFEIQRQIQEEIAASAVYPPLRPETLGVPMPSPSSSSPLAREQRRDVEQDDTITSSTSHDQHIVGGVLKVRSPAASPEKLTESEAVGVDEVSRGLLKPSSPSVPIRESQSRSRSMYLPPPGTPVYIPTPVSHEPSAKKLKLDESRFSSPNMYSERRLSMGSSGSSPYKPSTPKVPPPSSHPIGFAHSRSGREFPPLPVSPADSSTDKGKPATPPTTDIDTADDMKNFLNAVLERKPSSIKSPSSARNSSAVHVEHPMPFSSLASDFPAFIPSFAESVTSLTRNPARKGKTQIPGSHASLSWANVPSIQVCIPVFRLRRPIIRTSSTACSFSSSHPHQRRADGGRPAQGSDPDAVSAGPRPSIIVRVPAVYLRRPPGTCPCSGTKVLPAGKRTVYCAELGARNTTQSPGRDDESSYHNCLNHHRRCHHHHHPHHQMLKSAGVSDCGDHPRPVNHGHLELLPLCRISLEQLEHGSPSSLGDASCQMTALPSGAQGVQSPASSDEPLCDRRSGCCIQQRTPQSIEFTDAPQTNLYVNHAEDIPGMTREDIHTYSYQNTLVERAEMDVRATVEHDTVDSTSRCSPCTDKTPGDPDPSTPLDLKEFIARLKLVEKEQIAQKLVARLRKQQAKPQGPEAASSSVSTGTAYSTIMQESHRSQYSSTIRESPSDLSSSLTADHHVKTTRDHLTSVSMETESRFRDAVQWPFLSPPFSEGTSFLSPPSESSSFVHVNTGLGREDSFVSDADVCPMSPNTTEEHVSTAEQQRKGKITLKLNLAKIRKTMKAASRKKQHKFKGKKVGKDGSKTKRKASFKGKKKSGGITRGGGKRSPAELCLYPPQSGVWQTSSLADINVMVCHRENRPPPTVSQTSSSASSGSPALPVAGDGRADAREAEVGANGSAVGSHDVSSHSRRCEETRLSQTSTSTASPESRPGDPQHVHSGNKAPQRYAALIRPCFVALEDIDCQTNSRSSQKTCTHEKETVAEADLHENVGAAPDKTPEGAGNTIALQSEQEQGKTHRKKKKSLKTKDEKKTIHKHQACGVEAISKHSHQKKTAVSNASSSSSSSSKTAGIVTSDQSSVQKKHHVKEETKVKHSDASTVSKRKKSDRSYSKLPSDMTPKKLARKKAHTDEKKSKILQKRDKSAEQRGQEDSKDIRQRAPSKESSWEDVCKQMTTSTVACCGKSASHDQVANMPRIPKLSKPGAAAKSSSDSALLSTSRLSDHGQKHGTGEKSSDMLQKNKATVEGHTAGSSSNQGPSAQEEPQKDKTRKRRLSLEEFCKRKKQLAVMPEKLLQKRQDNQACPEDVHNGRSLSDASVPSHALRRTASDPGTPAKPCKIHVARVSKSDSSISTPWVPSGHLQDVIKQIKENRGQRTTDSRSHSTRRLPGEEKHVATSNQKKTESQNGVGKAADGRPLEGGSDMSSVSSHSQQSSHSALKNKAEETEQSDRHSKTMLKMVGREESNNKAASDKNSGDVEGGVEPSGNLDKQSAEFSSSVELGLSNTKTSGAGLDLISQYESFVSEGAEYHSEDELLNMWPPGECIILDSYHSDSFTWSEECDCGKSTCKFEACREKSASEKTQKPKTKRPWNKEPRERSESSSSRPRLQRPEGFLSMVAHAVVQAVEENKKKDLQKGKKPGLPEKDTSCKTLRCRSTSGEQKSKNNRGKNKTSSSQRSRSLSPRKTSAEGINAQGHRRSPTDSKNTDARQGRRSRHCSGSSRRSRSPSVSRSRPSSGAVKMLRSVIVTSQQTQTQTERTSRSREPASKKASSRGRAGSRSPSSSSRARSKSPSSSSRARSKSPSSLSRARSRSPTSSRQGGHRASEKEDGKHGEQTKSSLKGPDRSKRTDDRHSRQYHPYTRPDSQSDRRPHSKPVASFELAYEDLAELLECKTLSMYRKRTKQKGDKEQLKDRCSVKPRFTNYHFHRSAVPEEEPEAVDTAATTAAGPESTVDRDLTEVRTLQAEILDEILGEVEPPSSSAETSGEQRREVLLVPDQLSFVGREGAAKFVDDETRGSVVVVTCEDSNDGESAMARLSAMQDLGIKSLASSSGDTRTVLMSSSCEKIPGLFESDTSQKIPGLSESDTSSNETVVKASSSCSGKQLPPAESSSSESTVSAVGVQGDVARPACKRETIPTLVSEEGKTAASSSRESSGPASPSRRSRGSSGPTDRPVKVKKEPVGPRTPPESPRVHRVGPKTPPEPYPSGYPSQYTSELVQMPGPLCTSFPSCPSKTQNAQQESTSGTKQLVSSSESLGLTIAELKNMLKTVRDTTSTSQVCKDSTAQGHSGSVASGSTVLPPSAGAPRMTASASFSSCTVTCSAPHLATSSSFASRTITGAAPHTGASLASSAAPGAGAVELEQRLVTLHKKLQEAKLSISRAQKSGNTGLNPLLSCTHKPTQPQISQFSAHQIKSSSSVPVSFCQAELATPQLCTYSTNVHSFQPPQPYPACSNSQPVLQPRQPYPACRDSQPILEPPQPYPACSNSQPVLQPPQPYSVGRDSQPMLQSHQPYPACSNNQPVLQPPQPYSAGRDSQLILQSCQPYSASRDTQPVLQPPQPYPACSSSQPMLQSHQPYSASGDSQPVLQPCQPYSAIREPLPQSHQYIRVPVQSSVSLRGPSLLDQSCPQRAPPTQTPVTHPLQSQQVVTATHAPIPPSLEALPPLPPLPPGQPSPPPLPTETAAASDPSSSKLPLPKPSLEDIPPSLTQHHHKEGRPSRPLDPRKRKLPSRKRSSSSPELKKTPVPSGREDSSSSLTTPERRKRCRKIRVVNRRPWKLRYWSFALIPITDVQRNTDYKPNNNLVDFKLLSAKFLSPDPRRDPDRPEFLPGGQSALAKSQEKKKKAQLRMSSIKLIKDIPLIPRAAPGKKGPTDPRHPYRSSDVREMVEGDGDPEDRLKGGGSREVVCGNRQRDRSTDRAASKESLPLLSESPIERGQSSRCRKSSRRRSQLSAETDQVEPANSSHSSSGSSHDYTDSYKVRRSPLVESNSTEKNPESGNAHNTSKMRRLPVMDTCHAGKAYSERYEDSTPVTEAGERVGKILQEADKDRKCTAGDSSLERTSGPIPKPYSSAGNDTKFGDRIKTSSAAVVHDETVTSAAAVGDETMSTVRISSDGDVVAVDVSGKGEVTLEMNKDAPDWKREACSSAIGPDNIQPEDDVIDLCEDSDDVTVDMEIVQDSPDNLLVVTVESHPGKDLSTQPCTGGPDAGQESCTIREQEASVPGRQIPTLVTDHRPPSREAAVDIDVSTMLVRPPPCAPRRSSHPAADLQPENLQSLNVASGALPGLSTGQAFSEAMGFGQNVCSSQSCMTSSHTFPATAPATFGPGAATHQPFPWLPGCPGLDNRQRLTQQGTPGWRGPMPQFMPGLFNPMTWGLPRVPFPVPAGARQVRGAAQGAPDPTGPSPWFQPRYQRQPSFPGDGFTWPRPS